MVGGTVKQFKDALEEMKSIYQFDDEKTQICTVSEICRYDNQLSIITTDEKTGIDIRMTKNIKG